MITPEEAAELDAELAQAALADPDLTVSPDTHEALLAAARGEYIDPMAPLAEEVEALRADSAPQEVPLNNPTHRRLRAIAGAGSAYVFLTIPPEGGQVALDFWGIDPADLSGVLRTVAGATEVPA